MLLRAFFLKVSRAALIVLTAPFYCLISDPDVIVNCRGKDEVLRPLVHVLLPPAPPGGQQQQQQFDGLEQGEAHLDGPADVERAEEPAPGGRPERGASGDGRQGAGAAPELVAATLPDETLSERARLRAPGIGREFERLSLVARLTRLPVARAAARPHDARHAAPLGADDAADVGEVRGSVGRAPPRAAGGGQAALPQAHRRGRRPAVQAEPLGHRHRQNTQLQVLEEMGDAPPLPQRRPDLVENGISFILFHFS